MTFISLARIVVQSTRRTRNCLLNYIDPPVVVLIYHRVTTLPTDPHLLAVSPKNFRAQMQHLKDQFPLVRFEDDWSGLKEPSIAITFDDGYADNVLEALPILEEVGVPAIFFVSTGNLGTTREYWWDEVERLVMGEHSWLGSFTLDDCGGRTWPTATHAERLTFSQQLHPLMKQLTSAKREEWLLQLRQWAGAGEAGRATHRAMTEDELRHLAGSSWVSIGAHTATHTPLSILSEEQQRTEIKTSKQALEKIIGKEVTTFSYPFGSKKDYSRTSIRLCREAGFTKAASNFSGQVHRWTDPYQLPRQLVRNWDLVTFTDQLKRFWA